MSICLAVICVYKAGQFGEPEVGNMVICAIVKSDRVELELGRCKYFKPQTPQRARASFVSVCIGQMHDQIFILMISLLVTF